MHHRCRLLFPPDSCCESMGSLMRHLWDIRRGIGPAELADCVLLRQAGVYCVGEDRDEMVVAEVVHLLTTTSKYAMRPWQSQRTEKPHHIIELGARLHTSGRTHDALDIEMARDVLEPYDLSVADSAHARRLIIQGRSKHSKPVDLPAVVGKALDRCIGHDGLVKPLPLDVRHLHAQQRGATGSVLRERIAGWFDTKAGQTWQEERALLLRADDGECVENKRGQKRAMSDPEDSM